jgi:hypothetical protein
MARQRQDGATGNLRPYVGDLSSPKSHPRALERIGSMPSHFRQLNDRSAMFIPGLMSIMGARHFGHSGLWIATGGLLESCDWNSGMIFPNVMLIRDEPNHHGTLVSAASGQYCSHPQNN